MARVSNLYQLLQQGKAKWSVYPLALATEPILNAASLGFNRKHRTLAPAWTSERCQSTQVLLRLWQEPQSSRLWHRERRHTQHHPVGLLPQNAIKISGIINMTDPEDCRP